MGPGQSWTVPGRHPDFKKMRLQKKKAKKQKNVSDGSRQAVFFRALAGDFRHLDGFPDASNVFRKKTCLEKKKGLES